MTKVPFEPRNLALPARVFFADSLTRLGWLGLGATDRGICFLQFSNDQDGLLAALGSEFSHATIEPVPIPAAPQFTRWTKAIVEFLEGTALPNLPLDLRGTTFQRSVWQYLQTIAAGEVRSYSEVAQALGRPKAVRAVASACAKNRVALLVPCHRVLRGDGRLGGYKWGLERKEILLSHERAMR